MSQAESLKGRNFASAILLFSFFVSGCSALVYQMSWQRSLYVILGVDVDSVTIIVSVFMLGIGLGGMVGGWLADHYPNARLNLYAVAEFGVAFYGALTVWFLPLMGEAISASGWAGSGFSALASFLFLSIPTVLMGATLPLLTMAFNERYANIGVSVGTLYFVNTLGAAFGAALVPFVLFSFMTLSQVIWLAVAGNVFVACCGILCGCGYLASRRALV